MKRMIGLCASLVMLLSFSLLSGASAEEAPTVALMMTNGAAGSYVCYPQLEGAESSEQYQKINLAITETAQIEDYLKLLPTISESSTGLRVRAEYALKNGVLSVLISAEGKMLRGRPGQKYYAMMFDTRSGERIALDALFADADAGVSRMEELLDTEVGAILSTYMENDQLTPIPLENFTVLHDALLLCYDADQLSFLSGDSGAVSFRLYELADALDLSEDGVIARLSGEKKDDVYAAVAKAVDAGKMPGLSLRPDAGVTLHASLEDAEKVLKRTIDAGAYPGGSYIETEDPFMRGTVLLTDEAGETITGILSKRLSFYGVITGKTMRDEWRALLGEPTKTEDVDEQTAQEQLLAIGQNDIYIFESGNRLTLNADENGLLQSVILQ